MMLKNKLEVKSLRKLIFQMSLFYHKKFSNKKNNKNKIQINQWRSKMINKKYL